MIVIVGPTAVGKSALAIRLAEELNGEIVSADSRQIYRGMDIGTDKPSPEESRLVPHHLIDIISPDEKFTLAIYQEMAYATIDDILERGKIPFLVGGTGQYVWAVVEGWGVPRVEPDEALRCQLYRQAEEESPQALHDRLRQLDQKAAERIDPRNVRRVVRALEVCLKAGQPISRLQLKKPPPYRILIIGLTMPRRELYKRIDRRVERMIRAGLVEEVQALIEQGYGYDLPAMSGLGYRQICRCIRGEISLEEALQAIKKDTRRFVHQQYTWFRLDDKRIRWFDVSKEHYEAIKECVLAFLKLPG